MLQTEDINGLACLGLTVLQAKVYLTLVNQKKATIKKISQISGVARQEIYRVICELQERGLVEKVIAKPTEYIPVPIQDGIKILVDRKHKESSESNKKAMKLLKKYKNNIVASESLEELILL